MTGESITGILGILGAILSVVSVMYGIAQALQKADSKYVTSLQSRVIEADRRITALETSLQHAATEREKLVHDLATVTELLMDAQRQLAETSRDIRSDIAETTDVAKGAAKSADRAYSEANALNQKIVNLQAQLNDALRVAAEILARSSERDPSVDTDVPKTQS